MIEYPIYYRKFGIRRQELLIKPVLWSVNTLFLPFNSLIHYLPETETSMGIEEDNVLLQQYKRVLWVDHLKELSIEKGTPRNMPFQFGSAMMRYQRDHKRSRIIKDMETAMKDRRSIIVVNHAMAPHIYKYMDSNPFTPYNRWYNQQLTLWKKVEEMAKISDRQQFILVELPKILPAMSLLMRGEKEMTRQLLDKFETPEELEFLELWKWFGNARENSLLNKVSTENLSKVNLVFLESGRWTVLNLGTVNEWRSNGTENVSGKIDPFSMQKRFLRMAISVKEATSITANEEETVDDSDQAAKVVDEKEHIEDDSKPLNIPQTGEIETIDEIPMTSDTTLREDPKVNIEVSAAKPAPETKIKPKMGTTHDVKVDEIADIPDDTAVEDTIDEKSIDADIEELEKVGKTEADKPTVSYEPYRPKDQSLEVGVIEAADRIAKKGLITPAEYRRFTTLAGKYKTLPNPYGKKGTLADMTIIPPEVLKVEEKNVIADKIVGVQDASMLSSSLKVMDKRYIEEVLSKDTVSLALNVQKAGVAIQDYKVEKNSDLLDEYEMHTMKLVPVVGAPSTIKFKIPLVDKDGVFKAAGVKYRMRKQRGDLPIRKISPDEVALTSYYSKIFVTRSERAVFNYSSWLLNEITARGIDLEDKSIEDVRMANVFDHTADTPLVYSTIATRFAGFYSGKFEFFFDYNKRAGFFGDKVIKEVEGKKVKLIPIAKNSSELLMMDWQNQIHKVSLTKPGESVPMGDIEKVTGIPRAKRPVEIAEISIFAKAIPIAFVLGYHLGLGNLIATLGTSVRRVAKRERYELSDDEFIVSFNDEVLIFDRKDKMACLIFGSLNRFHRDLKKYSVYMFDAKEVYQIILENNSMGARYTREIELMFKMWVDHITKEILENMKEPTDLVRLLIRACELLTTDQHPAAVDNLYMRDKGYERFAGMMYSELVKAMRVYGSRPANSSATVELNPNAVWNTILQDPTVAPIQESSPIHNLKEKEVVVFRGTGGRTSRSMTAETRIFHRNSMGVTSEATSDNADVGTVVYLSADPNYDSIRGTIRKLDTPEGNAARMVSPSMLMAPGSEHDD
jgi:hypothetical protein